MTKKSTIIYRCQFYGADPAAENNSQLYGSIGRFFRMAVSASNGLHQTSVRENGYEPTSVFNVDLITFLHKYVGITVVDLLLMDIEGGEYRVTPFFYKNGVIDLVGITVCQINIEYHMPISQYNATKATFAHIMSNMLMSDFVPIIVVPFPYVHLYTLFVNYKNPICVEKYLKPLCSTKK